MNRNMYKRILLLLLFTVTALPALEPDEIIKKIDGSFYYPQHQNIRGFSMKIQYTGVDQFIKAKIDKAGGEKVGDIFAIYTKDKGFSYDVSSIAPRLAGAVNAILMENSDLLIPKTISETLINYGKKTHQEGKYLKLFAYLDKGKRSPIIRVEYYLDSAFNVKRTHAWLHTGESIDSTWDLIKNAKGLYMIRKNTIVMKLARGTVAQQILYSYKQLNGVYLPEKIVIKSRFENGETRNELITLSDHKVMK